MMYDDGRMRIFNRTILVKFSHLSEYQLTPTLYSVYPQLTRRRHDGGVGRLSSPVRGEPTLVPPTQTTVPESSLDQ